MQIVKEHSQITERGAGPLVGHSLVFSLPTPDILWLRALTAKALLGHKPSLLYTQMLIAYMIFFMESAPTNP